MKIMAVLSTANNDHELFDLCQDIFYSVKMTQMKGLKPPNVKTTFDHQLTPVEVVDI